MSDKTQEELIKSAMAKINKKLSDPTLSPVAKMIGEYYVNASSNEENKKAEGR